MTNEPLDPFSAEALLAGTNDAAGADPALLSMLEGLRAPATTAELAGAETVFAAISAAQSPAARSMVGRLSRRTAAIAAASIVAFGGVAAASVGAPVVSKIFRNDDTRPTLVDDSTDEGVDSSSGEEPGTTDGLLGESGSDNERENGGSTIARSDCGKPDQALENDKTPKNESPTLTPEPLAADESVISDDDPCVAFDNHGQAVSADNRNTATPGVAGDKTNNDKANNDKTNNGQDGTSGKDTAPGQQKANGTAATTATPTPVASSDADTSNGRSPSGGNGNGQLEP